MSYAILDLYGLAGHFIVSFGIFVTFKWYYMVLYCIVLHSWLRRAGCVSQDAYILHNIVIDMSYPYRTSLLGSKQFIEEETQSFQSGTIVIEKRDSNQPEKS